MPNLAGGGISTVRTLCLIALVLIMGGCGEVDWFPKYERLPTTPDKFTFTNITGALTDTTVTSNPITVSGLTGDSSPVSVSGPIGSNSKYSINSAAATDAAGTVKNGDRVTLSHKAATGLGAATTSTLTIGNVKGSFASTTQTVATPVFTASVAVDQNARVSALLRANDAAPHVISITDTLKSGNAFYSISDANQNPTNFSNVERTVTGLNGLTIFLRNLPSTSNETILTIDGVDFATTILQP